VLVLFLWRRVAVLCLSHGGGCVPGVSYGETRLCFWCGLYSFEMLCAFRITVKRCKSVGQEKSTEYTHFS